MVELSHNTGEIRKTLNINSRNNSVEYFDLVCNQMYRPIVRATLRDIQEFENGNALFFGGTCLYSQCSSKDFYNDSGFFNLGLSMSPPSKLSIVCIGPPTLPEDQTQGRFNLSWDSLPCHLQSGADISGYIINYTQLSTGTTTRVSNHHASFLCDQEPGSPYSCRVANSLFKPNQMYSFQVAAYNSHGDGSFSDPITADSIPIPISQGIVSWLLLHNSLLLHPQ